LNWCYYITDDGISKLNQLKNISLWSCEEITDTGVKVISKLPKLEVIELPELAKITDLGIEEIAKNTSNIKYFKTS